MLCVCAEIYYDPLIVSQASSLLLAAASTPGLSAVITFRYDVVDVLRQAMSDLMLKYHASFKAAYDAQVLYRNLGCPLLCVFVGAVVDVFTAEHRPPQFVGRAHFAADSRLRHAAGACICVVFMRKS